MFIIPRSVSKLPILMARSLMQKIEKQISITNKTSSTSPFGHTRLSYKQLLYKFEIIIDLSHSYTISNCYKMYVNLKLPSAADDGERTRRQRWQRQQQQERGSESAQEWQRRQQLKPGTRKQIGSRTARRSACAPERI